MEAFDGDINLFDPRNIYVGDEKLPVQFYMSVVQDVPESERAGRPIFTDQEFIKIFNSKDNIIDRPVRDSDKSRWSKAYAAWRQTGVSEPGTSGTRLEHWPQVTRAQVEELKYFKVFTIEQLADTPDSAGHNFMGLGRLKALAKAYVEAAKGEVPLLKMRKELETRDGQIAELMHEVKRLTKIVNKLNQTVEA